MSILLTISLLLSQGIIRKPRAAAGFRGTVRYAPVACHLNRELCRKDDVETWLYMQVLLSVRYSAVRSHFQIEITTGYLPWKQIQDMTQVLELRAVSGIRMFDVQVGQYKQRCRVAPGLQELFAGCPSEYQQVLTLVEHTLLYLLF